MGCLEKANFEKLPGVVPLVECLSYVDAVVTLQTNQLGFERGGQCFCDFRLPPARLALNEKRAAQAQGEIDRHRQASISDVQLTLEERLKVVDRRGKHGGCLIHLARDRAVVRARSTYTGAIADRYS